MTKKKAVYDAAMGIKRMGVILWCVLAITAIIGLHLYFKEDIKAGAITAMTLIAALGGVDVWKQNRSDTSS